MTLLEVSNLSKRFGATQALDDVSLEADGGEILALLGENGAGKSTLIKLLSGIFRPDSGTLRLEGIPVRFGSPAEAISGGVVMVPQELRVVPALSVAENLLLGHLPSRRLAGILPCVDRAALRTSARRLLNELNVDLDVDAPAGNHSFASRQLMVIARALGHRARVLILDEPTASLEKLEVEQLFSVVRRMRNQGVAVIYISHRLEEIGALADRCIVMRDGRVAARIEHPPFETRTLVHAMTGREPTTISGSARTASDIRTNVQLPGGDVVCRGGEVVGLAGHLGSGATELMRQLFGADSGLHPSNIAQRPRDVPDAISKGIGFVPGERALALVMALSVRDNIVLPHLDRFTKAFGRDEGLIDAAVSGLMDLLDIRPRNPRLPVRNLSGGNQQKVVFAKWLVGRFDLLLLDEPTNGIDIAAKALIHRCISDFADSGGAVLMSSSDMPELLELSDAVVALRKGDVAGRMNRADSDYGEARLRDILEARA